MQEPMIRLRATADVYGYTDDDEDYGEIESGWVQPDNPYGSLIFDEPDETESTSWPYLTLVLPLRAAARYAADFPGGVWDLWQDSDGSQNYHTGETRFVTLHLESVTGDDTVTAACLKLTGRAGFLGAAELAEAARDRADARLRGWLHARA